MTSNVLQRDNVLFARKLDPLLETSARLNDQKVDMGKISFQNIHPCFLGEDREAVDGGGQTGGGGGCPG